MNRLPQPFWAVVLASMGLLLCIVVVFKPEPVNIALAVLTVASNLVSGALGAFAGNASTKHDPADLPPGSVQQDTTTVQTPPVTITTPATPISTTTGETQ